LQSPGVTLATDLKAFVERNGPAPAGSLREAFFSRYAAELATAARNPEVDAFYDHNARISMCRRDTLVALTSLASLCNDAIVEFGPYIGGTTVALSRGATISDARVITLEKGGSHQHSRIPSTDILRDLKTNLETYAVDGKCQIIEGQYGRLGAELRVALAGSPISICMIDADGHFDDSFELVKAFLRPDAVIVVDDYLSSFAPEKETLTRHSVDVLVERGALSEWGLLSGVTWIGQLGSRNGAAMGGPEAEIVPLGPRSDIRQMVNADGHVHVVTLPAAWSRDADDATDHKSPVLLFEDDRLTGPPHASHDEINQYGCGAYCHWHDKLWFSSRDNSDPVENGRVFEVRHGATRQRFAARHGTPLDHDRVTWKDRYAGDYAPVVKDDQRSPLLVQERERLLSHTAERTADDSIDDLIYDLTGVRNHILRRKSGLLADVKERLKGRGARRARRHIGGHLYLDPKFSIDHFRGKRCLDVGCGDGRWTRTLLELGASVKSIDLRDSSIASTSRFNSDAERLNLFDILDRRPDLHEAFDFTLCWGVMMNTHNPLLAFQNIARTVKAGGELYIMVHSPTFDAAEDVARARRHYHQELKTDEERIAFIHACAGSDPVAALAWLDTLEPHYNWDIDEATIQDWCKKSGFTPGHFLRTPEGHRLAHYVRAVRRDRG
jgi:SAM-dependent methyltransferase/predicted O-methyltransferase YrrM